MTSDERHVVLSALIDREDVDPAALAVALDDPAGRALLVDLYGCVSNSSAKTPLLQTCSRIARCR